MFRAASDMSVSSSATPSWDKVIIWNLALTFRPLLAAPMPLLMPTTEDAHGGSCDCKVIILCYMQNKGTLA